MSTKIKSALSVKEKSHEKNKQKVTADLKVEDPDPAEDRLPKLLGSTEAKTETETKPNTKLELEQEQEVESS